MPSFVHNVKIVSSAPGSTINSGDALVLAPTSTQNNYFGSGSSDTGDAGRNITVVNKTKTNDQDLKDGGTTKAGTAS